MSITSKRKAQDLVREGKIHDAIGKLREGLSEGESDPYDHVYLGDLLMRVGETEGSLSAYQTAIRSYEDVGLYRNAVAIGKKMLRIDSRRPELHRCLASLYDREGLHGEAIPHYLTYLDSFVGEQVPPTEFLETLDQVAAITGSKVEVALRLTEHFIRIRRIDRAAALLEGVATNAEAAGSPEMAEDLRRRATELLGVARGGTPVDGVAPPPLPSAEPLAGLEFFATEEDEPELRPLPPPLREVAPIAFDANTIDIDAGGEVADDSGVPPTLELDDPPSSRGLGGVFEVGGAAGHGGLDEDELSLLSSADARDRDAGTDPDRSADDENGFVVEHFAGAENDRIGLGAGDSDEPEDAIGDSDSDFGAIELVGATGSQADPASGAPGSAESDLEFGEVDLFAGPGDTGLPLGSGSDVPSSRAKTSVMAFDADALGSFADGIDSIDGDGSEDDPFYEIELEDDDSPAFELTPVSELRGDSLVPSPAPEIETESAEAEEVDFAPEPHSGRDAERTAGNADTPTLSGVNSREAEATSGASPEAAVDAPISIDQANDAFLAGRWSEARRLYEHIIEEQPDNRRILARLVETVRYLQDHHGEVHYLVQLGEVWIAEEELEEALECFLKVVHLDPENATAKRRLSRFREMKVRGAEVIEESDSNSVHGVLETGRSEVAVRDSEESFRSEDWVELEGLLEEFKDGLKSQMDDGDYQGHYDLALAYHGMGLLEEALEAADRALICETIPLASERLARELKGSCLNELHRYREAVHEYREAVEKAGTDRQSRRTALYHLARSLEALEEWQEAVDTYVQLRMEAPGFLDVEERMRTCERQLGDSSSRPPSEAA